MVVGLGDVKGVARKWDQKRVKDVIQQLVKNLELLPCLVLAVPLALVARELQPL